MLPLGSMNGTPELCNTYIPTISVDPSIAPQVHYVVYNIYKINRFFTTWFYATLFAKSQASDSITNIIQTINPPEKTNVLLNDILSALIAGLAFVSTPGGAAVGGIAAETSAVSTILTTALKQAPSVAKAIWPVGTTDSVIYQIGQLQEALGDVTDQLRDSINAGLQLVMTDMSAFQAFAANGAFSSPKPPSLQNETTGLQWGFTTFLVSKSLTENGWDALFTTPARVGSRDENGNIKEDLWWCSPKENGFCFFLNKSINPKGGDNILSKVINTGWTTGDLLFDGALTCLQEGKTEGVPVTLNAENQLDLNCLSRMNLCTSHPESHDKPIACPVPFVDGKCPYPACRD
ncbi:MAG: hypothetical protein M1837_004845 [Sclerophora amabilis]|nr:MAG: hypothetical protein M1837_004845 [Sclerophora amabilis]